MDIRSMRIGMRVRSQFHGEGEVRALSENSAQVLFSEGMKTVVPDSGTLEPVDPQFSVSGGSEPLVDWVREVVAQTVDELGVAPPEDVSVELGHRWDGGELVLRPQDPTLQAKELPIETFFHKIVMMRNNLRVLEQKVNGNGSLSDAEKVELQQYITRCYGSMTSFNVLFRDKASHFKTKG